MTKFDADYIHFSDAKLPDMFKSFLLAVCFTQTASNVLQRDGQRIYEALRANISDEDNPLEDMPYNQVKDLWLQEVEIFNQWVHTVCNLGEGWDDFDKILEGAQIIFQQNLGRRIVVQEAASLVEKIFNVDPQNYYAFRNAFPSKNNDRRSTEISLLLVKFFSDRLGEFKAIKMRPQVFNSPFEIFHDEWYLSGKLQRYSIDRDPRFSDLIQPKAGL